MPASATCNEAVKLAQKKGFHRLKGFVNGVLRNISRNLEQISLPDPNKDSLKYLSIKYSMPEWILELWMKTYSLEETEEFLQAFLADAPLSVRVNQWKSTKEDLIKELEAGGIHVWEHETIPGVLYLEDYDYLAGIPAFQQGKFYVQDISSVQAGLWADPKPSACLFFV